MIVDRNEKFLKNKNLLELVPVKLAGHVSNDSGKVDIRIPKFRNQKFAMWFIPKNKSLYYTIHLDEHGTAVWNLIDGNKTVEQIGLEMETVHGNDRLERLSKFVMDLYHSRCITFKQLTENH